MLAESENSSDVAARWSPLAILASREPCLPYRLRRVGQRRRRKKRKYGTYKLSSLFGTSCCSLPTLSVVVVVVVEGLVELEGVDMSLLDEELYGPCQSCIYTSRHDLWRGHTRTWRVTRLNRR